MADDDPAARPRRRAFTAEYKLAILEQYDRLEEPGARGALLRREGTWRYVIDDPAGIEHA